MFDVRGDADWAAPSPGAVLLGQGPAWHRDQAAPNKGLFNFLFYLKNPSSLLFVLPSLGPWCQGVALFVAGVAWWNPPLLLSAFLHVASTLLSFMRAGGAQGARSCLLLWEVDTPLQNYSGRASLCDTALVCCCVWYSPCPFPEIARHSMWLCYLISQGMLFSQINTPYSIATGILLVVIRALVSFQTGSLWPWQPAWAMLIKVCKF